MNIDLELILVIGTLVTGVIVFLDKYFFANKRRKRVLEESYQAKFGKNKNVQDTKEYKEPWYIDYSRSFLPVLLIVLILRSFIAEPFRIPSGSMMPTLLHGDFILVNKFTYGLRLPVSHKKVWSNKLPARGDVAVFRFPDNPSVDYIKRVIGLPGDTVSYRDKKIFINGVEVEQTGADIYFGQGRDSTMNGSRVRHEQLFDVKHKILLDQRYSRGYGEWVIPDGEYFVMGDNRDNSNDSRFWGTVPEENLVGKAFLVWMNWDISAGQFDFGRIGTKIK
jgi:signal peptidase I